MDRSKAMKDETITTNIKVEGHREESTLHALPTQARAACDSQYSVHPEFLRQSAGHPTNEDAGPLPSRRSDGRRRGRRATGRFPRGRPRIYNISAQRGTFTIGVFYCQADLFRDRSVGLVNGSYDVRCRYIEDGWSDACSKGLSLVITLDGARVWAEFNFGVWTGIMLLQGNPTHGLGRGLPLAWRGHKIGQAERSSSTNNSGFVSFLGDGKVEGYLTNMFDEKCDFQGLRQPGLCAALRTARSMRDEWESYDG